MRAAASDITPLRDSPPFRRLFAGQAIFLAGTQVTQVAVPLQVYAITHSSQLAIIAGPLLAGTAIAAGGYQWAYGIDVLSFGGTLYAAARLPRLRPGEGSRRAGLASIAEGLRFIAARRVVLMTFLMDINAMLFSSPRALFPALAHDQFGGGARTAGLLYAAPAVGAVAAPAFVRYDARNAAARELPAA